jgi:tetratricopeptide (TPR) repeat protein
MSVYAFDRSWKLAQRWAVAVAAPEAPPANALAREWLVAASAFEELGQPDVAGRAYASATQRWPDDVRPWQALANARYAQRDLAGAEAALRHAHALQPSAATLNNLAQVLLERGCPKTARSALAQAATLDATDGERQALERTRAQVEAHRGRQAAQCGPALTP